MRITGEKGGGFAGTIIKDTWTIITGGGNKGWWWGGLGWGRRVGRKCRQL